MRRRSGTGPDGRPRTLRRGAGQQGYGARGRVCKVDVVCSSRLLVSCAACWRPLSCEWWLDRPPARMSVSSASAEQLLRTNPSRRSRLFAHHTHPAAPRLAAMAAYPPPNYARPPSHSTTPLPPPPSQPFAGAAPLPPSNIPPGTLPPGTIVHVGQFTVTVDRYLSEGGFAHVYLASSARAIPEGSPYATTKHVLKRMAVPDQAGVEEVGKEVKVMVRRLLCSIRRPFMVGAGVSSSLSSRRGRPWQHSSAQLHRAAPWLQKRP